MADDTHDVCLLTCLVKGIFHRLAIHGQRGILCTPRSVPGGQCPVERARFNSYQTIANDEFAGHEIDAVLA